MQGKIVKGIAGFYYVHVVESGVYECKAKGIFRKDKKKPLVGDDVEIEVLSEVEKTGSIINIFERKNELIRPAFANIDQALVVFAAAKPSPHFNLLDRFLVMMQTKDYRNWRKSMKNVGASLYLSVQKKKRIWKLCAGCWKVRLQQLLVLPGSESRQLSIF